MFHQLRVEATLLIALGVAIAALVVALQRDSAAPVTLASDGEQSGRVLGSTDVLDGAAEVQIVEFAYEPEPIRVKAGQTVAWTNEDAAPHTVTGAHKSSWDSGYLLQGGTYVQTFDQPGVYPYICTLHPPVSALGNAPDGVALVGGGGLGMEGTIIVE